MRTFDHLIIHCSATPPTLDADAQDIDRWHRDRGWRKIGYHEVITRDGQRQNAENGYKARKLTESGAHVGHCGKGWNSRSIGVCLVGGVDADNNPENNFTDAQFSALAGAVKEYTEAFNIPMGNVMGHRDLIAMTKGPAKACPSFDVAEFLGKAPSKETGGPFPAPLPSTAKTHTVIHGDTLSALASRYSITVKTLMEKNKLTSDLIRIGQVLEV